MDNSNYKTTKKPVRMEYQDDIDIPEFREIPTYKRMCICILKMIMLASIWDSLRQKRK